jgi:uncharacterized cupredoxin-like copper-binding protein
MQQRFFLGLFFLASIVLIVACGGNGNTKTTSTGATSPAPSASTKNAQAVTVTVTDTKIESTRVTFTANLPYDFTVTNKGHSAHDFIIRRRVEGPQTQAQINEGIVYIISANKLLPGTTVHFTYGFTQASIKSTMQFEEHLAGKDAAAGPLLPIQVTQ